MKVEESIEEKLKRVITAKKVVKKGKYVRCKDSFSDLRTIPKKQRKKNTRMVTSKRGKLCGANHITLNPNKTEILSKAIKLSKLKKDVFFMVDGLDIQEKLIDPINTNSGVLFEEELKYLE